MQSQVTLFMNRFKMVNYIIYILGFLFTISACLIRKITNNPVKSIAFYKINKPKYQVVYALDSVINNNQLFFKEKASEPDYILVNLKNKQDTIMFVLYLREERADNVTLNDSTTLFVVDISKYVKLSSDTRSLYPPIDSFQKRIYLNQLDSFIIQPLKK